MSGDDDDPGGPLRVTPVGTVVVSTDSLLASADRLRALEAALHADVGRVMAAERTDGISVRDLVPALERARDHCERARDVLRQAAERYAHGEQLGEEIQRRIAGLIAAALGHALPFIAGLALVNTGQLVGTALAGWLAIPDHGDGRLATLRDWMITHPELVTSPEFVRFVSLFATSIDDGALAASGVPLWVAPLLGEGVPAGDHGVAAGALTVATLGSTLGMFRETPVAVERVGAPVAVTAPSGARDRLDRVPEVNQVRVETFEAPGMPTRYAVYIGPTETFSPYARDEPWDLTSNVYGVAGLSPGSLRAVEEAMVQSGIRPGDEVQVVGFSQGGLLATMVAASGDWNVVGAVTYGAPAGNIPLPEGVSGIAVRNTDDFIPALAGPQLDHRLMQIEREAFAGDTPPPRDMAAPAHQRVSYEATADAIDVALSSTVQHQLGDLDRFGSDYLECGGSVTSVTYHAERTAVSAASSP